jgi:hypothetical protein
MKKMSREREEDSRRKLDSIERRNKELESDMHRMSGQHKVMTDKTSHQREHEDRLR